MGLFVDVVLPTACLMTVLWGIFRMRAHWYGVRRHAHAHLGHPSPQCFSASSTHHTWEGADLELALERGEKSTPLALAERDLDLAREELADATNALTRRLFGYRSDAEPGA